MHQLQYITENNSVPRGVVTSTARRGTKWARLVSPGDVVDLCVTETGASFGKAVVIEVEVQPLLDVLEGAEDNHVGHGAPDGHAPFLLASALYAAYGTLELEELFTVIFILPINETQ